MSAGMRTVYPQRTMAKLTAKQQAFVREYLVDLTTPRKLLSGPANQTQLRRRVRDRDCLTKVHIARAVFRANQEPREARKSRTA